MVLRVVRSSGPSEGCPETTADAEILSRRCSPTTTAATTTGRRGSVGRSRRFSQLPPRSLLHHRRREGRAPPRGDPGAPPSSAARLWPAAAAAAAASRGSPQPSAWNLLPGSSVALRDCTYPRPRRCCCYSTPWHCRLHRASPSDCTATAGRGARDFPGRKRWTTGAPRGTIRGGHTPPRHHRVHLQEKEEHRQRRVRARANM